MASLIENDHFSVDSAILISAENLNPLARGGYGEISIIENTKPRMVMKSFMFIPVEDEIKAVKFECDILHELDHDHIIKCAGRAKYKHKFNQQLRFGFLMDYCEKGSLDQIIKNPSLIYSIHTIVWWAEQLFGALKYLNEMKKVHRDIKPGNILVTNEFQLKICDFGIAKFCDMTRTATHWAGTDCYMSPERQENSKAQDSHRGDVYSMGLVLWELVERRRIYEKPATIGSITSIGDDESYRLPPITCISELCEPLFKCTKVSLRKRSTAAQVLPSFKDLRKKYELFEEFPLGIEIDNNRQKPRDLLRPIGFDGTVEKIHVYPEDPLFDCFGLEMDSMKNPLDGLSLDEGINSMEVSIDKLEGNRKYLKNLKEQIRDGQPIRGVQLSGWLVIEYFMTEKSPIWRGVPMQLRNRGEYRVMKHLGHAVGDSQFDEHRRTMITERDFEEISRLGLNTVKIPIGYWIVGFDKTQGDGKDDWKVFAPGALQYLDLAITEWALKHKLLVIISYHAAKGSQNAGTHSAPSKHGHADWSKDMNNVNQTLEAVQWLVNRYKDEASFLGITLLNAPKTQNEQTLRQYYHDCYGRIRHNLQADCFLFCSPLVNQKYASAGIWNVQLLPPVHTDCYHQWDMYQIWNSSGMDFDQILEKVISSRKEINSWTGNPLFIGEWCLEAACDMTDEQLHLYAQEQLESWSQASAGWCYNTWKFYGETDESEGKNRWSLKSMIKHGFIADFD